MPYYVTPFVDGGVSDGTPLSLAVGQDQPGSRIIDLRADGGASISGGGLNACLLYVPADFIDARVMKLADLPDEVIPVGRRNQLASRVGKSSIMATRWDQIVGELMLSPPIGGWRPLRAEALGTRFAAYLGPLTWTQNVMAGGCDLYERLQTTGLIVHRRCLVADDFTRPPRWAWRRWFIRLLNVHGFGVVLATDNFNRADATDLGANWTDITNEAGANLGISGNTAADDVTVSARKGAFYSAITWPDDQYAEATAAAFDVDNGKLSVMVRVASAAQSHYDGGFSSEFAGNDDQRVWKYVTGTGTSLATQATPVAVNDLLNIEAQGTTLKFFVNGTQQLGNITDTALTSGNAGLGLRGVTANSAKIDDWSGGDFVAAGGDDDAFEDESVIPWPLLLGGILVTTNPAMRRRTILGLAAELLRRGGWR